MMKIGFQLKQVRERLAKGLVDKGVLRTEKRNFLLFDMATHPVSDVRTKEAIINRVVTLLTSTTSAIPPGALDKEGIQCRVLRAVCLVCAAYSASVLDNAFGRLGYEEREAAFQRCDDILGEFVTWPFGSGGIGADMPMPAATAASIADRSVTSARALTQLSPSSSAMSARVDSSTSVITTFAPRLTSARAVSAPIPRAAPVMRTTLPLTDPMGSTLVGRDEHS